MAFSLQYVAIFKIEASKKFVRVTMHKLAARITAVYTQYSLNMRIGLLEHHITRASCAVESFTENLFRNLWYLTRTCWSNRNCNSVLWVIHYTQGFLKPLLTVQSQHNTRQVSTRCAETLTP